MNDDKISMGSEPAPRIGSVLETASYVADIDRSVAFYRRVRHGIELKTSNWQGKELKDA